RVTIRKISFKPQAEDHPMPWQAKTGLACAGRAAEQLAVSGASGQVAQVFGTHRTSPTSANAITTGKPVLALGTTSGTTITATQVIVQPAGGGSAASAAAKVIPFQCGA